MAIFFDSEVCKSQRHCDLCRGSHLYRKSISKKFEVPEVDFECPFGKLIETEPESGNEGGDFPDYKTMARSLGNSLVEEAGKIATGVPPVSSEKINERLEICQKCPNFKGGRCKLCGCNMRFKARLRSSKCPVGRW